MSPAKVARWSQRDKEAKIKGLFQIWNLLEVLTKQLLHCGSDFDSLVLAEPVPDAVKVDGHEALVVDIRHWVIHAKLLDYGSSAVLTLL